MEIYQEIVKLLEAGRRGALATVVGARGSTPGKEAAKMLIRDDGTTCGTIGGGCTEAEVWALARDVIEQERPLRRSFRLTAQAAAEEGLACGGVLEVFVEPLGNPTVIVFGAGHVARLLVPLCKLVGFHTHVVDDRAQFANRERFPDAAGVWVSEFESSFAKLPISPTTYIVIVTRGHRYDQLVLGKAVRSEAQYVGLIGSRPKILTIFRALRREGVPEERLRAVQAPIGLDIGARGPEEIAVSIVAQLIAHRRRAFVKGTDPDRVASPPSPLAELLACEELDETTAQGPVHPASPTPAE
jgi:xanthine dehydrogenase accessory factor